MKKNHLYILAASSLFLLVLSCGNQGQSQKEAQILPFPVITVSAQTLTSFSSYPTSIEGEINSEVRPKVSGYIKDVYVDEGAIVKQGQLLFKLETESLTQQAAALKASVNVAQVEVEKLIPLVEKNIISKVQLESAKAQLAQAKSNYSSVTANINYATIKSPVDGVMGSINYRKGALVSSQDPMPIATVSSIDNVFAYFSLNEKDFIDFIASAEGNTVEEKINQFPKLKLKLANGEFYEKEGSIETIAGNINQQTGTITFRAKFLNEGGMLRNGSSGTILIPKTYKDALVIPTESTFERQGKYFVYVVNADTLAAKPITIKTSANRLYVLEGGIEKGETILAKGLNKVGSGSKIKPVPTPLDSIINSYNTVFK